MPDPLEQFQWSLKNGDLDQVSECIEKMSIDVNKELSDGRPPLHHAADYGQQEVIKFLIEKGADVNAADKFGITPLLAAIWEGHTECVRILLQHGATKDGKTPDGSTYLDVAEKDDIRQLLQAS